MRRPAKDSGLFSVAVVVFFLISCPNSLPAASAGRPSRFRPAPPFRNAIHCLHIAAGDLCHPELVHIAITLDGHYLRGSVAAVHSLLRHSPCPDNLFVHFLTHPRPGFRPLLRSTFPLLRFSLHPFHPSRVLPLISSSLRPALEHPLNYARNYLPHLLPRCVRRAVYLDSDLVLVDDVAKLWNTSLGPSAAVAAPEYCHTNFTKYFTKRFWSDPLLSRTFSGRRPCYFNTGVMVIDLDRWRSSDYTRSLERWMEVQKSGGDAGKIYALGSLPPFLLVFAGRIAAVDHRWNQHGLGGDNVRGSCRDLHPGPVSLLHWSGKGKPWSRLDDGRRCPLDSLWAPFDLYDPPAGDARR